MSFAVLSANKLMLEKLTASYDTQATVAAISLAQATIDEIQRKSYDQNTISRRVYNASDFTPVNSLGPDAGETSRSLFNDVDDYNGYTSSVSAPTVSNFTLVCKIEYVTESDPNTVATTQTFYKRITVTVQNTSMQNPVVMQSLVVYRRYF